MEYITWVMFHAFSLKTLAWEWKTFCITLGHIVILVHAAMRASEMNPRLGWCWLGEDFMCRMRQLMSSCTRGVKPADVGQKVARKWLRFMHLNLTGHAGWSRGCALRGFLYICACGTAYQRPRKCVLQHLMKHLEYIQDTFSGVRSCVHIVGRPFCGCMCPLIMQQLFWFDDETTLLVKLFPTTSKLMHVFVFSYGFRFCRKRHDKHNRKSTKQITFESFV